jgi:hypothetical protein
MSLNCNAKKEEENTKKNTIRNKFKNMYKAGSEFRMRCGNGSPE